MNSWKKIVFKQIEPIHLGYKKHGVINETRIFITGQSIWGAITNAYVKSLGGKKEDYDKYQNTFENITCFYPKINGEVLYPKYKDGEFYLRNMSEKEFRNRYVTTYLSTAINPNTLNAKDESLHEIDVILPDDIYWVGYLKIDKNIDIPKEIYIGGDSRYGFGKMKLEREPIEENFNYEVKKGVYQNKDKIKKPLKNFLKFDKDIEFNGELELLAEFDFSENRAKITKSDFYIGVGSEIIK